MKKAILILGGSHLQLPAIEKAIELGHRVIVADMNPNSIGFSIEGVVPEVVSTTDLFAILDVAKKHNIDGIMTLASDMPIRTVAFVSEKLGLPGVTLDTAQKATDKWLMRNELLESNVPIPIFKLVDTVQELKKNIDELHNLGYQVIVKPVDSSGSRGIQLIDNDANLDYQAIFEYSSQYSKNGKILVEEFMTGPEVSVETFAQNGIVKVIQITDKLTTGAPYFVEMGHSQPSQLPKEIQDKISSIAIAANHALGISEGPSHTEIKVTATGPKIVELGARLGGDTITTHLVPLSTGVDLVKACIDSALGNDIDIDIDPQKLHASAIRFFKTPTGILKKLKIDEQFTSSNEIIEIHLLKKIGDTLSEIHSSVDRAGYVITQAGNVEEAIRVAEEVCHGIEFEV